MSRLRYMPLGDHEHLRAAWARSGNLAFSNQIEKIEEYLNRLDRDRWCRVLVDEHDELIATLMRTRVGLNICGGRVSSESVGFVSIPPEHRGKRASVELMHHHLREAHQDGAALSILYSARARLYRGVGYESAGRRSWIGIPLRSLKPRSLDGADSVSVRAMNAYDEPGIRAIYAEQTKGINGHIDRDDWFWGYTLGRYQLRMRPGFIFEREGKITGYMLLTSGDQEGYKQGEDLTIHDLCFADAPTARSMIRFLSGFSSTRGKALLQGDLSHPLLDHIDELWYRVEMGFIWFARIVNFERAITQRGFNPCVQGEIILDLQDDLLSENAGVWKISVRGGQAHVQRNDSEPQVRMNIDALPSIYTGFTSASMMARNGRVDGDRQAIEILDGLFAAPTPWFPDNF